MSNAPSREAIERAFVQIERAAVRGERFPMNGDGDVHTETVNALTLEGRLRVHIRGYNWREGVILVGPHAGKWTQSDPKGGRIYLVLGHDGKRRIRRGEQPLAPRITFTELIPSNADASPRGMPG